MALGGGEPVHIVWSHCLGQGSESGFAFVFRPGRLLGAAKPTTMTVVLEAASFPSTEARPGRRSFFHRDARAEPRDRMMEEVRRELVGSAKAGEVVRFGETTTVVRLSKDSEEARRIAAELGVNLDALPAARPPPVPGTEPGAPPALQVGPPQPATPPDLGWIPRDPIRILMELESAQVFEIPADRIERIEVVPPGPDKPGRIVIRTPVGVEVVNVTPPVASIEDPIPALLQQFEALAPGRVVRPG